MLDTLIKIGKWRAEKMMPIERFLTEPKKLNENKTYYVAEILFDIDEHDIKMNILKKLDVEKDKIDFLLLKTLQRRNKAIYTSVEKKKFNYLLRTFFGKIDLKSLENVQHGELYSKVKETETKDEFLRLLDSIIKLKNVLLNKIKKGDDTSIDIELLLKEIPLNNGEEIGMIIASIKSETFGINQPTPISKLKEYKRFINKNFLSRSGEEKICYATGKTEVDVGDIKIEESVNFNRMFVITTINYASNFKSIFYKKNYQVSIKNQTFLDLASKFITKNYTTQIAGIHHVIIPVFFSNTETNIEMILMKLKNQSDILFNNDIKTINTNITDWIDDIYWLNFIAYITEGGQTFKTVNVIKDVSKPWFLKIIETMKTLNNHLAEHYNSNTFFNFYEFYKYIPVKTDSNKNEALELFKDVFEHRMIDKNILFKHFTKYLIVQRSGQFDNNNKHRAYKNIKKQKEFDYAVSNSVLNYLVFIKLLKNLKLLNNNNIMEENINKTGTQVAGNDYRQRIEQFFDDMNYTAAQKALFYLGRALNDVAYAQFKSNHQTKPVMNKLNYNGMDKDAVMRLYLDLAEKVRQYASKINISGVEYNFSRFIENFNPNIPDNSMTPEENVFYILSGYSFGMIIQGDNKNKKEGDSDTDKDN